MVQIKEILTATMVLFAVIDIVGSIPIIINLKQKSGQPIKSLKASIISGVIMIAFLFVGENILHFIGIDVNSFAVAGSFILFFLGLELVLNLQIFKDDPDVEGAGTISIVPIAFPLIAGAGTMTSVISLRAEFETVNILIAILINIVVVYFVLRSTTAIERVLGKVGIAILKKVFGIILLAIAVKLFATNAYLLV